MTRPIEDILRDAWRLRDEFDAAAVDLSGQALQAGPENVLRAVETVTAMLYFKERHKWEAMLGGVLDALAPDVFRIYQERGAEAAYEAAHGREDT